MEDIMFCENYKGSIQATSEGLLTTLRNGTEICSSLLSITQTFPHMRIIGIKLYKTV